MKRTTKEIATYGKYLEREAKKFKITREDLSNLTDLDMMLPHWFVKDVLKPNKMDKWWYKFAERISKITLNSEIK